MAQGKLKPGWVAIKIVDGVEGTSLYINDFRCVGPKPWGGGEVVWEKNVQAKDFMDNVRNALHTYLPEEAPE